LLALGGWFEEKKKQIKGAQETNRWKDLYCFSYNILKFTNQFFFIIIWEVPLMYPEFDYKL